MAKQEPEPKDVPREMVVIYNPKTGESKHVTPTEWDSDDRYQPQGWLKQ